MGIALHVLYSLAGIGLIIKSSILLFTFIKICGGVYLVYLGFKSFLSHTKNSQDSKLISAQNSGNNFKIKDLLLKGFLTNALNPKVTMFFFMIFSQFIDSNTPFLLQVIIGLETILLTFVWFVVRREQDHFVQEWMESVGEGVPGYVTPKVAVGAVVGNAAGEMLLVRRSDSGVWLYPTGWADVGYSPAEVAVKEVAEETGIICEPVQLLAVLDGQRMGFTRFGMYMLLFHCRATGGSLQAHPLETSGVGWFGRDALPPDSAGAEWWAEMAFAAIDGAAMAAVFEPARPTTWRQPAADPG